MFLDIVVRVGINAALLYYVSFLDDRGFWDSRLVACLLAYDASRCDSDGNSAKGAQWPPCFRAPCAEHMLFVSGSL